MNTSTAATMLGCSPRTVTRRIRRRQHRPSPRKHARTTLSAHISPVMGAGRWARSMSLGRGWTETSGLNRRSRIAVRVELRLS
jgi:hypothetical protein